MMRVRGDGDRHDRRMALVRLGDGRRLVRRVHAVGDPALQPRRAAVLHRLLLRQLRLEHDRDRDRDPEAARPCRVATPPSPTGCGSTAISLLPWGGLPLGGPLQLAMALPQMLASVIGLSPYARTIRYQYTAMMIAPIVIAAIEGAALAMRYKIGRRVVAALADRLHVRDATSHGRRRRSARPTTNVWAQSSSRHDVIRRAIDARAGRRLGHRHVRHPPAPVAPRADLRLAEPVGDGVLRQRRRVPAARPERDRVHRARPPQRRRGTASNWSTGLIAPGGEFEVLFDEDDILVAKRK